MPDVVVIWKRHGGTDEDRSDPRHEFAVDLVDNLIARPRTWPQRAIGGHRDDDRIRERVRRDRW